MWQPALPGLAGLVGQVGQEGGHGAHHGLLAQVDLQGHPLPSGASV